MIPLAERARVVRPQPQLVQEYENLVGIESRHFYIYENGTVIVKNEDGNDVCRGVESALPGHLYRLMPNGRVNYWSLRDASFVFEIRKSEHDGLYAKITYDLDGNILVLEDQLTLMDLPDSNCPPYA